MQKISIKEGDVFKHNGLKSLSIKIEAIDNNGKITYSESTDGSNYLLVVHAKRGYYLIELLRDIKNALYSKVI